MYNIYATLHHALSVHRSVSPSVGPSVYRLVHFYWEAGLAFFGLTTPAQMVKWLPLQPLPTRKQLEWPCIRIVGKKWGSWSKQCEIFTVISTTIVDLWTGPSWMHLTTCCSKHDVDICKFYLILVKGEALGVNVVGVYRFSFLQWVQSWFGW